MNLRGTVEGERGGGEVEEGSVYCQPGSRVDGNSRHSTRRGFPSRQKGVNWCKQIRGKRRGASDKRELLKRT